MEEKTMYLNQLKGILNRYPDSMECFIRDGKLICKYTTEFAKSELVIDIPLYTVITEGNENI